MKVLAKIILGIALFAIVVAVSYLKTDLQGKNIDDKIDQKLNPVGVSLKAKADEVSNPETDSTLLVVKQEKPEKQEKQEKQEGITQEVVEDSPNAAAPNVSDEAGESLEAGQGDVTELLNTETLPAVERGAVKEASKPKSTESSESPKQVEPPKPPKDPNLEVISYFQGLLNDLPEDLTSYEKKVAIKEIRDIVCDHYKITHAKLNSLSQKYKIRIP